MQLPRESFDAMCTPRGRASADGFAQSEAGEAESNPSMNDQREREWLDQNRESV